MAQTSPTELSSTVEQLTPDSFDLKNRTAKIAGGSLTYDIGNYHYPADVSGASDLKHYVAFFINIRGKSKQAQSLSTDSRVELQGSDTGSINRDAAGKALRGGTVAASTALGLYFAGSLAKSVAANATNVSKNVKVVGTLGTMAAGGIGGYLLGDQIASLFETDKRYRIKTAIMLAINERPSVKYSVDYAPTNLGDLTGFLAGGASAKDYKDMASEAARAGLLNLTQVPAGIAAQLAGTSLDLKSVASAVTAQTPNPFREQIFQSVENRIFNFDYKFLPKSQQETDNVRNIINQFKLHMHPEISAQGLFYIYPSEFNIVYYYAGKENRYFNKISTCVLTDMQVDYGNSSNFGSFQDGAPTEINMRLTFRELEVLTRERIEKGY